jgi:hypothetical protein
MINALLFVVDNSRCSCRRLGGRVFGTAAKDGGGYNKASGAPNLQF